MMPSKYLSAVLFEVSISGTLEVSISGAFGYQLARYPLYRNICEYEMMKRMKCKMAILTSIYKRYVRVSISDTIDVSIGGTYEYWPIINGQHMYACMNEKLYVL